ncbi:MAG: hypothetical protein IJV65_02330, partial [Kiritimatiellae bacterium]|nr:hypothetical protein [Kiritimatiellia bacterium]
ALPSPAPVCFVHEDAGPDAKFARSRAAAASRCLALCGVDAPLFPWAALTNALSGPCRVAHLVFPLRASAADLAALDAFAARGGRVVVHYSDDPALAAWFGLRAPKIPGIAPAKGAWTGFDFLGPPPLHAPASVPQAAPRVVDFAPAGKDVKILARWRGAPPAARQGPPALLRGPRGFWLARPLYDDMPAADASRLLLSLTAALEPSVWKTAAKALEARLPDAGRLRKLALELRKAAPGAAKAAVAARFDSFRKRDEARRAKTAKGLYGASLAELWEMDRLLFEAEAVARPLGPDRGKARLCVWAKGGWPPGTNTWESCAAALGAAGVSDVFLFAGSLSASIPAAAGAPADPGRGWRGDPFPAAVKALHARGIRVHAWVFALQADLSPGARYAAPGASKRLLHAPGRAAALPWLDPAAQANGDDLSAWLRSLAAGTGVDGVSLDYFRYPEEATAEAKDPAALRSLLSRLRADLRAAAPSCELSVNVYAYVSTIGQAWDEWLEAGLFDTALVMNYAPDLPTLRRYMAQHPRNRKRQICGVGAASNQSLLSPRELLEQLREAFRGGYAGAAVYPFDVRFLADWAPALRLAR